MADVELLPLPEPGMLHTNEPRQWFTAAQLHAYTRANIAPIQAENERLRVEVSELRAARIAYANEFPATEDGDPDTGNIHANIRALQAENERLRAEVEDYRTNGAAAVRYAPNSAHWSNELRRLFGDDARAGIEVLENWHLQELARADRLAEALRGIRRDALDGCSAMDCARDAFDVLNELGLLREQEKGHEQ